MQIYPSVLETDIDKFVSRINTYTPIFPHMQIDIADGYLVDNKTIQIEDIIQNVSRFKLSDSGNTFEFHLMVRNWEAIKIPLLQLTNNFQIDRVLIHAASFHSEQSPPSGGLKTEFEWGLVLNPEDEVGMTWAKWQLFPAIQIMTVEPGRQGNPFLRETLNKIGELRQKDYRGKIILDGGINEESLPIILQQPSWPDAVCPGSYFNGETEEKLQKLQDIVQEYQK